MFGVWMKYCQVKLGHFWVVQHSPSKSCWSYKHWIQNTDSCITLHQKDKAFALAPQFTLLMKNSTRLRPPSIKTQKELIQRNDRCTTMENRIFFKVYGLLPKIKILLCLISFFLCVPLRFRIFFWQRNKKVDTRDPKFPGGSFYNFILCWWTLSTVGSIIFFRGQCPPPSTAQWVNVHKGSSQKNINQLSWGGSLSQTVPSTAVQNVICTDTESNSQAVLEIGRDGPASAIVHKWQQSRAIQMAKRKEGFVSVVRRNVF